MYSDNIFVIVPELEDTENQIDVEVTFWGTVKMVDNGIGAYEYWGSVCYDVRIEPEVQEIFWDKTKYTDEQNIIINKYVDDNFDDLNQNMVENFDDDEE